MATAPTSGQGVRHPQTVYLDWTNTDGNILITPSDESRFVIKIGAAIEILRQHGQKQQAEQQFDLLLKRLAGWLDEHRSIWHQAYLTAGEGVLRFIVVRKQVRYDDVATDSLSDLELDIARDTDLSLIKLSTTALPSTSEESLRSFLNSDFTLEYGSGTRPHSASQSKS